MTQKYRFMLSLDREVHKKIKLIAVLNEETMNRTIIELLKEGLKHSRKYQTSIDKFIGDV